MDKIIFFYNIRIHFVIKRGVKMRFKRNRKGDLNLSMNAIVTLVLAMAMLGVGLFVVNMVMSQTKDKFAELKAKEPVINGEPDENYIAISSDTKAGAASDMFILRVKFKNGNDSYCTAVAPCRPLIKCSGTSPLADSGTDYGTGEIITVGKSSEWIVIAKIATNAEKKIHSCKVYMQNNSTVILSDVSAVPMTITVN
jgi:hypothetical protein